MALNILVVDPRQCAGFFLKSILLGKGYGVSLSGSFEEARGKVFTGLFDLVLVDMRQEEDQQFLRGLARELPGLPLVPLCEPLQPLDSARGGEAGGKPAGFRWVIERPIRVPQVVEVVAEALRPLGAPSGAAARAQATWETHLVPTSDWDSRAAPRSPALSEERAGRSPEGEGGCRCRALRITERGSLLEPWEKTFSHISEFHRFFEAAGLHPVRAAFRSVETTDPSTEFTLSEVPTTGRDRVEGLRTGRVWDIPSRIAFQERAADQKIRQIGLAYALETSDELERARDLAAEFGSVR